MSATNLLIGELDRIKLEENPYSIGFIPKVVEEVVDMLLWKIK